MKHILGYKGLYSIGENGMVWSEYLNKFRKLQPHNDGYLQVNLSKNNKSKIYLVHRLVAQAYIPNPKRLPQVNHKNGIKTDNRVENLEWCNNAYNCKHAHNIGLSYHKRLVGENARNVKLSQAQVDRIRKVYKKGGSIMQWQLAIKYKVSQGTISEIVNLKKYLDK